MSVRSHNGDDEGFVWVQSLDGRQSWPDDGLSDEARVFGIAMLSEAYHDPSDAMSDISTDGSGGGAQSPAGAAT